MKTSILLTCVVFAGCTNTMPTPEPRTEGDEREFITLLSGQICEIKDTKIVACERNTYRYAESKSDLKQMEANQNEN